MKIALCQMEIMRGDREKNRLRACGFIRQAAMEGAELILFPEMSLTGFCVKAEKVHDDGREDLTLMQEQARRHRIHVGYGTVYTREGKGENHYLILDPGGETVLDYTKIHPFSYSGEDLYFRGGSHVKKVKLCDRHFSAVICYDLRFPELFQSTADETEIFLVPANWPCQRQEHWQTLLRARAIETQCYVVGINCTDGAAESRIYAGGSAVYGPDGRLVCGLGEEEGLLTAEIPEDVEEYRRAFPMRKDRRPEIYGSFYS